MSSFENFVQCRIVTPLAASATDVALYAAVAPYRLPPEAGGVLVLTDSPGNPSVVEVVRYSHRTGLALYGLQRGQEGTTARDWTGPVFCYQALMAGDFQSILDELNAGIDGKVDKATGQSLMTDAERTKLSGIAAGAQVNTITSVAGKTGAVALAKGDVGLANVDNTSDVNKPVSTAQQTALDGKVGTGDARLTDTREWTATTVAQAEAEAGTATTRRAWTAQRVRQAVAAWWAASAMKTKLDGIATGATANATDAQLRDRSTHTGTQAVSTITGLGTAATANTQTSSTDTTSGAMMAVGAFGLGAADSSIMEADNVWKGSRIRGWSSTATASPASGTEAVGLDLGYTSGRRFQTAVSRYNDLLFRYTADPTVGDDWRRVFHDRNILGTVSQLNGIPTGAIFERGSNANGEYTKYADGTLECWTNVPDADVAAGEEHYTSHIMPAQFVGSVAVTATLGTTGTQGALAGCNVVCLYNSSLGWLLRRNNVTTGTRTMRASLTAKGRWY